MATQTDFDQLIQYFILLTKNHFTSVFDEEDRQKLFSQFETQFQSLLKSNEDLMPNVLARRHGINAIFVLALHQVLNPKGFSYVDLQDMVLGIYRNMLHDYFSQMAKQLDASPEPWKDFVVNARIGNQQQYDNEFFCLQETVSDGNQFGFDIHRCLYFEILQRNGHPELGTILCEYDHIFAQVMEKWVEFKRTETIAEGAERCDFRFYRRTGTP